jgi:TRAP-type C4-dicarboxylate transport system substrate-binding protein
LKQEVWMKRKLVTIVLSVAVIASLVIVGCAPKAAPEEKLIIRYSTDRGSTQASSYAEMEILKPKVEELIPNCEMQQFYSASLYRPPEAMNQLILGNLEMAAVDSDGAGWDPWCNIWAQPMVLTTVGAHMEYRNGTVAKAMEERMLKKGIRVLGWEIESMLGGVASPERVLAPEDVKGKKLRISAALTQGPMVESWDGSPVSLSWGDVPPAVQTGVVDGVITSVGGYKTLGGLEGPCPYYTVFGMGGVFTDFYMVMASEKWWQTLDSSQQDALVTAVNYFVDEFEKMQYAEDQLYYKMFGTEDPSKPGIYIATPEEVAAIKALVGDAIIESLLKTLGEEARPLIEAFNTEGAAMVKKYPPGTHPVEAIDVEDYREAVHLE